MPDRRGGQADELCRIVAAGRPTSWPRRRGGQADELPGGYLRMQNVTGGDIRTVLGAYGVEIEPWLYTRGGAR